MKQAEDTSAARRAERHKRCAALEKLMERLFREGYGAIKHSVMAVIKDNELATDCISEALKRAWEVVLGKRGTDPFPWESFDHFCKWIVVVAKRAGLDQIERFKHEDTQCVEDIEKILGERGALEKRTVESLLISGEIERFLDALMARVLDPTEHLIVTLRFHDGWKPKKIGDEIGMDSRGVSSRLYKAIRKLDREIKKLSKEEPEQAQLLKM